ncbi:uncharacterized protein BDZ83DRAFT_209488 [Colletotrichum acutatum]|uniref:Uncharacterized protein n=1 Tax=Glomerella acutata TaxID=27357 RepID=A0AAD8U530_GLOAC|nr:uncharacterized protein BDZ83DRAFT_209488 [Colletotrichum acutatum]KAK1705040.1 hypothetical protein BDZ83DRAFT_209488 [Colletotrichum acutatum]
MRWTLLFQPSIPSNPSIPVGLLGTLLDRRGSGPSSEGRTLGRCTFTPYLGPRHPPVGDSGVGGRERRKERCSGKLVWSL